MATALERWIKIQKIYFRRWQKALQEHMEWDRPHGHVWNKDCHGRWYKSYFNDRRTMSKAYWARMASRYHAKLRYANRKVRELMAATGWR